MNHTQKLNGHVTTLRLEFANGEGLMMSKWLADAIKTQDLSAWATDPKEFKLWLARNAATMLENIVAVFTVH